MIKGVFLRVIAAFFLGVSFICAVEAKTVTAIVTLSKQQMVVSRGGKELYRWTISTGRNGYTTPAGMFKPTRMHKMWHSRKYNNAPMPYAIFYHRGYAVHGTTATGRLGKPASHGCVRLQTENAKKLFYLVKKVGSHNATVIVRQ